MVGVPCGASGGGGVGVGVGVAGDVIGRGEGEDLRRAAAKGDTVKLLALLEEGADVNLSDEVGPAGCPIHLSSVTIIFFATRLACDPLPLHVLPINSSACSVYSLL